MTFRCFNSTSPFKILLYDFRFHCFLHVSVNSTTYKIFYFPIAIVLLRVRYTYFVNFYANFCYVVLFRCFGVNLSFLRVMGIETEARCFDLIVI